MEIADTVDVYEQIVIKMFASASCLSAIAEDRTVSSGPPPTLDVLQPAPGTVSLSVMFHPCFRFVFISRA